MSLDFYLSHFILKCFIISLYPCVPLNGVPFLLRENVFDKLNTFHQDTAEKSGDDESDPLYPPTGMYFIKLSSDDKKKKRERETCMID